MPGFFEEKSDIEFLIPSTSGTNKGHANPILMAFRF